MRKSNLATPTDETIYDLSRYAYLVGPILLATSVLIASPHLCASVFNGAAQPYTPIAGIHDEPDPTNENACFSMGQLLISYSTDEKGLLLIGGRVIDPRGRKFGYDPSTRELWQELPLADGFVTCDDADEGIGCAAHIEICGPVSGIYKLEILPARTGSYSINVMGESQRTWNEVQFYSTQSHAETSSEIRTRSPETFLLNYSRSPRTNITLTPDYLNLARPAKSQSRTCSP